MKDYADRADRALDLQTKVIEDQSGEIQLLRRQLDALADARDGLLDAGDYMAEQYQHTWKDKFSDGSTPLSVIRWQTAKERNAR